MEGIRPSSGGPPQPQSQAQGSPHARPLQHPPAVPTMVKRDGLRQTTTGAPIANKKKNFIASQKQVFKKKIPCTESIQVPTSLGLSPKNDEHLKDIESTLAAVHIPYTCKQWLFFFLPEQQLLHKIPSNVATTLALVSLLSFAILHFPKNRQSGTEINETKWCWRIRQKNILFAGFYFLFLLSKIFTGRWVPIHHLLQ